VEVLVDFTAGQRPTVAGLYAEGRIETSSTAGLTLPATAVVQDGDQAFAWRVQDNKLQKVSVALGERDVRSGEWVIKTGLAEGDRVLRHPGATVQNGQPVEMSGAAQATTQATT
jgi:membrane fusion protein (multidrug efflux system)